MTPLVKPVTRVTTQNYTGRATEARRRKLVATLLPGDLIALRPQRTRRVETIPLSVVYDMALWARIRAERAANPAKKKKKRHSR